MRFFSILIVEFVLSIRYWDANSFRFCNSNILLQLGYVFGDSSASSTIIDSEDLKLSLLVLEKVNIRWHMYNLVFGAGPNLH